MEKILTKKNLPNVYIRRNIPEKYLEEFREVCSNIIVDHWDFIGEEPFPSEDLSECNVLFTVGLKDNLKILNYLPNIKWIHSISVGLDAMLQEHIIKSDVIITNSKGCTSIPIAEHTIALITSLARGLHKGFQNQAQKKWENISVVDLESSTVGIIGYGEIGYEVAKRCKSLGMSVIGCRRNPEKNHKQDEPTDKVVGLDEVDYVLQQADFVVLALPSTKDTIHFIDKERLHKMKKSSYLINVGRGNTIVEEDLIEVLLNGQIAGAALDVFDIEPLPKDHAFWNLDNVMITPHNAYNSSNHVERVMNMFLQNLQRYAEGEPLLNVIDKQLGY